MQIEFFFIHQSTVKNTIICTFCISLIAKESSFKACTTGIPRSKFHCNLSFPSGKGRYKKGTSPQIREGAARRSAMSPTKSRLLRTTCKSSFGDLDPISVPFLVRNFDESRWNDARKHCFFDSES